MSDNNPERHTFVATFDDGSQLMVEEYLANGDRWMYVASRENRSAIWGPPRTLEQTS